MIIFFSDIGADALPEQLEGFGAFGLLEGPVAGSTPSERAVASALAHSLYILGKFGRLDLEIDVGGG